MPSAALFPVHRRWLSCCICLVFAMVVLGGLTRLTESGLSIVEWKLLSGTLPPMGETAWQKEFSAYQTSPQYRAVNQGMGLSDFQRIYWLEYLHRLLGRIVGMLFFIPLFWFALRRRTAPWLSRRMALASLLVAAQGTVGWLMVKSGLQNVPWVSPYRLALHLSLAVSLFGWLITTRMRLVAEMLGNVPMPLSKDLRGFSMLTVIILAGQIVLGAFVAGLHAGLFYNSFPLMGGQMVPAEFSLPHLLSYPLADNIVTIQFLHRWWAFVAAGFILALGMAVLRTSADRRLRRLALGAMGLVIVQILLGISALLLAVPVALGTLHQAMAVLLFGWSIALAYAIRQSAVDGSLPQPFSSRETT